MATVKCYYCQKNFDRDKSPYVKIPQGQRNRYGHKDCYLKAKKEGKEKNEYEIIDPSETVICIYCKQPLKKTDFDCRIANKAGTKFAHLLCKQAAAQQPKTPEESLNEYIMDLFDCEYVLPAIQKQIKNYIENNHFTYSGIQGSLKYWYEIKGNPVDKKNPHIGIVGYCYTEAKNYYAKIYKAKKANENINFLEEKEKISYIKIEKPKRKVKKRKLFSFLDKEEVSE